MSESSVNRGSQNMVYDVEREDGNVDVIGNDEKINNYSRHLIINVVVLVLVAIVLFQ